MTTAQLQQFRDRVGRKLEESRAGGPRLSPLDLHHRMDQIRESAAANGVHGLERLAERSAQLALLPGHRIALDHALDRMEDSMACAGEQDITAMLAAIALRLN